MLLEYEDYKETIIYYWQDSQYIAQNIYDGYYGNEKVYNNFNSCICKNKDYTDSAGQLKLFDESNIDKVKKVYMCKNVVIPKGRVSKYFKVVSNPYEADLIVINKSNQFRVSTKNNIYVNDKLKMLVYGEWYNNELTQNMMDLFTDNNKAAIKRWLKRYEISHDKQSSIVDELDNFKLLDANLIFYIDKTASKEIQDLTQEIAMGIVPLGKCMYSENFIKYCNDSSTDVSIDELRSIKEMLFSKDIAMVQIAMRTIANINFTKYYNIIAIMLMCMDHILLYNMKVKYSNSLDIKMLKHFFAYFNRRDIHVLNKTTTDEELDLIRNIFTEKERAIIAYSLGNRIGFIVDSSYLYKTLSVNCGNKTYTLDAYTWGKR